MYYFAGHRLGPHNAVRRHTWQPRGNWGGGGSRDTPRWSRTTHTDGREVIIRASTATRIAKFRVSEIRHGDRNYAGMLRHPRHAPRG